jgi:hypothetical protein
MIHRFTAAITAKSNKTRKNKALITNLLTLTKERKRSEEITSQKNLFKKPLEKGCAVDHFWLENLH